MINAMSKNRVPRKIKKAIHKALNCPNYPRTKWVRKSRKYVRKFAGLMFKVAADTAKVVCALDGMRNEIMRMRTNMPLGGIVNNKQESVL